MNSSVKSKFSCNNKARFYPLDSYTKNVGRCRFFVNSIFMSVGEKYPHKHLFHNLSMHFRFEVPLIIDNKTSLNCDELLHTFYSNV